MDPSLKFAEGRTKETGYLMRVIVALLLSSFAVFAQGNYGRILGTVTDQTGAVIPGATVTVIDKDRGITRTLVTDSAGEYSAPQLLAGTYMVRAAAKGFQTLQRDNVQLVAGGDVRVDLAVQTGTQEQTVEVSAAIPQIDTTSSTLGGTVSDTAVNDLPLNGRNYQSLMGLRPGVLLQKGGSPWTQSTNNIRPDQTSWMIDGLVSETFYDTRPIAGSSGFFTDGTTILPLDSIHEMDVTENPKAEYGGNTGAVTNVIIKSGTNTLRGSAYAFGRDGSWDARNLFNPAPSPVQPVNLQQFGGSLGGPIKKDKLFFFANYEALNSYLGGTIPTSVPETASQVPTTGVADPANSMVDAIIALQSAGVPVSPVSKALLGCPSVPLTFASTCTGGYIQEPFSGANNNTTSYLSTIPLVNDSDNGIAKIDYQINQKNSIDGMFYKAYYAGKGQGSPNLNTRWAEIDDEGGWEVSGNWTYAPNSNWVNEVRVGYTRFTYTYGPDDPIVANGTGYPINTGTGAPGMPAIIIGGFGSQLGGHVGEPQGSPNNPYFELQDNVSYLRGKHSFKFGGDFGRIEAASFIHDTQGQFNFQGGQVSQLTNSSPLEDFFAGLPTFGFRFVGNTDTSATWHELAGYIQDDWRIVPKVMLNLGMRYSYFSPPREVHNSLGNFDPNSPTGLIQQGQPGVNTLWKPDYGNWSPRLGLAWDLTGNGRTVLRAGAGMYYSLFSLRYLTDWSSPAATTNPAADPLGACTVAVPLGTPCPKTFGGTIANGTVVVPGADLNWNGVVFPASSLSPASLSCTAAVPCSIGAVNPNLRTPHIVDWSFGVQHAFTNDLSLDVSYVANHGDNLLGLRDINQVLPGTVTAANPAGTTPYAAQFPYLQFINEVTNDAISNYNSLQVTLEQRLSHGLTFIAGYTYGHGLDNGSLNVQGLPPQNSYDPMAEYASSDFDIRHRATFSASYKIPRRKGFGQLLEGWTLNAVATIQGGQPWTVIDGSDNFAGNGENIGRWDFFGNPSDFSGSQVTPSSLPFCSGFGVTPTAGIDTSGATCASTSGVSGVVATYPSSMAQACATVAPDPTTLATAGCFVSRNGKSVMVPPTFGTFGTMGRGLFRDAGFRDVDFSVFKIFSFKKERYNAEFRAEFFNVFNTPLLANPSSFGTGNNPANPTTFGCGCATPDVAAGNAVTGSGSAREIQLGFKLTF